MHEKYKKKTNMQGNKINQTQKSREEEKLIHSIDVEAKNPYLQ